MPTPQQTKIDKHRKAAWNQKTNQTTEYLIRVRRKMVHEGLTLEQAVRDEEVLQDIEYNAFDLGISLIRTFTNSNV